MAVSPLVFAARGILQRKGGTALRGVWVLRGQGRMPSKGEMAQGCPILWRGEGLGFQSLLSISIYWASSMDQPLPRPWRYKRADLPPCPPRARAQRLKAGTGTAKTTAPAKAPLRGHGDFLLQLLCFEPTNSLARNKIRTHISV